MLKQLGEDREADLSPLARSIISLLGNTPSLERGIAVAEVAGYFSSDTIQTFHTRSGPTLKALLVWDRLSQRLYNILQTAINNHDLRNIPAARRHIGLLSKLSTRDFKYIGMFGPALLTELTCVLAVYGVELRPDPVPDRFRPATSPAILDRYFESLAKMAEARAFDRDAYHQVVECGRTTSAVASEKGVRLDYVSKAVAREKLHRRQRAEFPLPPSESAGILYAE